jgi:hypothetical protein
MERTRHTISGLTVGKLYTRKDLAAILGEKNIAISREGIFYCKKRRADLFFVDLEKKGKERRLHYNDYFDGDVFHWDSQTTQHLQSPKIVEIIETRVKVLLFVRRYPKIKNATQPFVFCGELDYLLNEPDTNNPAHLVFTSIDYEWGTSNPSLKEIYMWSPQQSGRKPSTRVKWQDVRNARKRQRNKPTETSRLVFQNSRVGQDWYRGELLTKWQSRCAVTGIALVGILVASHIKPWSECTQDERLDKENGILLAPQLDALFDRHLISFDGAGRILIHSSIGRRDRERLGVTDEMRLRHVSKGMKRYLSGHRKRFFNRRR